MNFAYNFSYPCKVLSSFYDNYHHIHIYDLIKRVLLKKEPLNNIHCKKIHRFLLLFNILITYKEPLNCFEQINNFFIVIFEKEISPAVFDFLDPKQKDLSFVIKVIKNFHTLTEEDAFLLFLLATLLLSKRYGYCIVLPTNICDTFNGFKEMKVLESFSLSYFNCLYKKENKNLKLDFINFLKENSNTIKEYGICEIYLFGSIMNDEYYDSSDFDLVLKFSNIVSINIFERVKKSLNNMILNKFYRFSDIYEYEAFILEKDIDSTIKVFPLQTEIEN